jgi:hypothetical protein
VVSFTPRLFEPWATGECSPGNQYIGELVGSSQCGSCGDEKESVVRRTRGCKRFYELQKGKV